MNAYKRAKISPRVNYRYIDGANGLSIYCWSSSRDDVEKKYLSWTAKYKKGTGEFKVVISSIATHGSQKKAKERAYRLRDGKRANEVTKPKKESHEGQSYCLAEKRWVKPLNEEIVPTNPDNSRVKWECPSCGRSYQRFGKLMKKMCPECEQPKTIPEGDYICKECRG